MYVRAGRCGKRLVQGRSTRSLDGMPNSQEHIREFTRRKTKFWAIGGLWLFVAAAGFIAAAGLGTADSNSPESVWWAMLVSIIAAFGGVIGFAATGHLVLRCPNCGRPPRRSDSDNAMHQATWCVHCNTRLS